LKCKKCTIIVKIKNKIMDLIGKIVELKKIKDKVFNGKHPNGVFVGNTLFGFCMENPDVGKPLIYS